MLINQLVCFSEWDHVQDVQVRDRAAGRPQTRQTQSVGERHRHGTHVSCHGDGGHSDVKKFLAEISVSFLYLKI